jgi:pullulanase
MLISFFSVEEFALTCSAGAGFSDYCYPGSDLGAVYRPGLTRIKVWAPTAVSVSLKLFADAENPDFKLIPMTADTNGVWTVEIPGDQAGKYYLYQVTLPGQAGSAPVVNDVNDPYAKGSAANSTRTLIYDPAKTNPRDWEHDHFVPLRNNTDAILYELHVRDFTISPDSGISPGRRGKFLGLVEPGTRGPAGQKTGLDHLTELGITHVHLLPVFDYAYGDERQPANAYSWYNWGYDPVLYNNPEGSYASDPDGTARQQEFKLMVQGLHQRRIGVIMDVVFNHTAETGFKPFSIFDKIYPGYYYRRDASGHYADATGCGNELASERPMARKFIVDSIRYWMTEYHVDGFRFDLMGILDRETMLEVYRAAREINPNAIIYGEGWNMEQVLPANRMMTQSNLQGTGIAAFNDGIRDNIKGNVFDASSRGFVEGSVPPYGGMPRFWLNLKGQSTGRDQFSIPVASPNETINYDSVHDDLCLWDRLQLTARDVPENSRIRMDQLAAGILLTAQGVPFIHAGDEFLRSKKRVGNSFNNNDPDVNPIQWSLKATHANVFDFYRGLIALRNAHPAFRMARREQVDAALEFKADVPGNLVIYVIRDHANGDAWRNILVVYNGSGQAHDLTIPGQWTIVANDQHAGVEALQSAKDRIHVEAYSLVIAHTDGYFQLHE